MKELIDMLHAGGYSCVIANGDRIRTFTRRGVADLYDLRGVWPTFTTCWYKNPNSYMVRL